ncbi:hypothetical protein F0562_007726 [Nyssa sinensis]|uniref:Uncharacterized protein n=1 Tax=Nyssa sinensis TaxID=561372 RepID=A0A5J5A982_9ASTE|nr:hypothetical protein F0562_007726 [Nyssa sinensis]
MAFYVDEEDVWKCPKHPSKRRRSGICPICLRERLRTLCPDCANVRPCACCTTATNSSSSSSSSSFSRLSSTGLGTVGRMSNLIDIEPAFRRSRSVGIPFFRSRHAADRDSVNMKPPTPGSRGKSSFWSVFKTHKSKKDEETANDEEVKESKVVMDDDYARRMMMRSKSVGVPAASNSGAGEFRSSSTKGKRWHFPSPIKAFRQSKTSKIVHERTPLYRGKYYSISYTKETMSN